MSLIDDPKMHKDVAEKYSRDNFPFFSNKKQITHELKDKINIGYYSADFKDHAVLHVDIRMLFSYHNKSQFNIYGF